MSTPPELRDLYLSGEATGHPRFAAGERINTGRIIGADGRRVWTENTLYELGNPSPLSLSDFIDTCEAHLLEIRSIEWDCSPVEARARILAGIPTATVEVLADDARRARDLLAGALGLSEDEARDLTVVEMAERASAEILRLRGLAGVAHPWRLP
jgi:hypothetical protein